MTSLPVNLMDLLRTRTRTRRRPAPVHLMDLLRTRPRTPRRHAPIHLIDLLRIRTRRRHAPVNLMDLLCTRTPRRRHARAAVCEFLPARRRLPFALLYAFETKHRSAQHRYRGQPSAGTNTCFGAR